MVKFELMCIRFMLIKCDIVDMLVGVNIGDLVVWVD